MNKNLCAPNINKYSLESSSLDTCFTLKELIEIANAYNNFYQFSNSKKGKRSRDCYFFICEESIILLNALDQRKLWS